MYCRELRCFAFVGDCAAHNCLEDAKQPIPLTNSISLEARDFILRSSDAEWEMADLSTEGVAQLRQENSEVAALAWKNMKESAEVTIEHELVGGVECQWVCPLPKPKGSEVVLYFFGGGFVVGSPDDDLAITARIAVGTGRRVCVPRYRLAPESPYPAATVDAMAVYRALIERSDPFISHVFVVGESAGGNLALDLLLKVCTLKRDGIRLPTAAALLSPWIDLTHSGVSHSLALDPTLSLEAFLAPASRVYAGLHPRDSAGVSPLFTEGIPSCFPPVLISTATRDLLMSDSVRLAQRLQAAGCRAELRVVEGLWHVYEWYPQLPEARTSVREIAKFLLAHCPP